jgi:hypothetical protein
MEQTNTLFDNLLFKHGYKILSQKHEGRDPYTVRVSHASVVWMDHAEYLESLGLVKRTVEEDTILVTTFEFTEKGKQYLDMMLL